MVTKALVKQLGRCLRLSSMTLAIWQMSVGYTLLQAQELREDHRPKERSPIKHVIIIVGENRTFDHVFATYKPNTGERVDNLLSKGIIHEDGSPGPNYSLAAQYSAEDANSDNYQVSPGEKTIYNTLPPPLTGGPQDVCKSLGICTLKDAQDSENGLDTEYYKYMLTGGTGLPGKTPDERIQNVLKLPAGPFQLTSSTFPYDAYAASPVHRFYQMWQQADCNTAYGTIWNPSGCKADLFPWVEVTIGAGSNGNPQKPDFDDQSTGEGATAMGFYNVLQGDAHI